MKPKITIDENDDTSHCIIEKIKDKFANARNAASGSLRQKDPKETSKIPLKFIAYTFGFVSEDKFKNQSDFLKELKSWGFLISEYNKIIKSINELIVFHQEFHHGHVPILHQRYYQLLLVYNL